MRIEMACRDEECIVPVEEHLLDIDWRKGYISIQMSNGCRTSHGSNAPSFFVVEDFDEKGIGFVAQ